MDSGIWSSPLPPGPIGREREVGLVRAWLDGLASGPSGLRIRGEPGIGKTTIWSFAASAARDAGIRVLESRPVEAELPLGFAGLADLLSGVADEVLDALPGPLAGGLARALFVTDEPGPGEPHLAARATLAALRALAARGPVVLAIDDLQWLDPASARALAFAVRRLGNDAVGVAVTIRDGFADPLSLDTALGERLVDVELGPMTVGALGQLLRGRIDPAAPRRSVVRAHERSGGNPFFALELMRGPADDRLPPTLAEIVGLRLAASGPDAAAAIERVAVLGPGSISSFANASSLDAATGAGVLIERHGEIRFAHPLLAAGAYAAIAPGRRRALHRQAAAAASGIEDRARHLALATGDPDPDVAAVLEDAALTARSRGAPETGAELAAHAVRLTPASDVEGRARRAVAEADCLLLAADEPAALLVLETVLADDDVRGAARTKALVLRALLDLDAATAVARLEAAVREPHDDRTLAAGTLAQLAWQRGAWLGDVATALPEARAAVGLAEPLDDRPTLVTALTTLGLVSSLAGEPAEGSFRRALEVMGDMPGAASAHTPRLAFAHERWWRGAFAEGERLLDEERALAEMAGDEGLLMRLDIFAAELEIRRGRWDCAAILLETALLDARAYWRIISLVWRSILRARRGDPAAAADALEVAASPVARGEAAIAAIAEVALGMVDLAAGRRAEAADRMAQLSTVIAAAGARGPEFVVLIPETVAALVEAGRLEDAEGLTRSLEGRRAGFEPWSSAALAMCEGLLRLGRDEAAASLDRLAAARAGFDAIGAPWELGLVLLAEGRALRRLGRRRDAADTLERAVALFAALGAVRAGELAADELRRARPRPRQDDTLTAAETRVAELVVSGQTNKEVATRLFTTVATVEAHLTRIYSKTGVRSRTELARRVADGDLDLGPPTSSRVSPDAPSTAGPPGSGDGTTAATNVSRRDLRPGS